MMRQRHSSTEMNAMGKIVGRCGLCAAERARARRAEITLEAIYCAR